MRPLVLALPASLMLLAFDAGAQSNQYPVTSDSPISSVEVRASDRPVRVYQEHLDAVKGQYALSNGWRLKVDSASGGVMARIDKQRPIYLKAVTPDKYVSRDGNVDMVFNQGDGGDMTMSYVPPGASIAQIVVVKATLAGR